jgi:hypothetical protein
MKSAVLVLAGLAQAATYPVVESWSGSNFLYVYISVDSRFGLVCLSRLAPILQELTELVLGGQVIPAHMIIRLMGMYSGRE